MQERNHHCPLKQGRILLTVGQDGTQLLIGEVARKHSGPCGKITLRKGIVRGRSRKTFFYKKIKEKTKRVVEAPAMVASVSSCICLFLEVLSIGQCDIT